MPPKRKKQSRKTTQTQRQSQKVVVNIGTSTKRKRKGGGGGGHRQNLAPTFITAPQVDYTPLLAMMSYQTRSLQQEPVRNPVTPLSSVAQALPAEQMAGEAAIRRAGPTAATFEPVSHMEREIEEKELAGGGERMGFSEEPVQAVPKRGRPFVDLSKLAAAEPVLDPLAVRQSAKVDIREPPQRTKSLSFLPSKPPALTRPVNAPAEQFVPSVAPRGNLSRFEEEEIPTPPTSDEESEPKRKPKFTVALTGALSAEELNYFRTITRKRNIKPLSERKEKQFQLLKGRLAQFGDKPKGVVV